jgi:diaminohydroxyphosphoribosylaminopyrimidine deaminase/5-amino-6-(5-phosphoribosylamino)uracil reductase
VTLEPCCTHGRTPPCTDAIVDAGIRRVVVGATDPNPAHAGKGFDLLRAGGVEVVPGVLGRESADLNLIFNHWIATGRPLFAAKSGVTLDGKVATRTGDSKWITGEAARANGHLWRRYFPAIAVGAGTVRADNPRLTARVGGVEWCPWRFVFDGLLRTVTDKSMPGVFTDEFRERTIVVTTPHGGLGYVRKLNAMGVKAWVLNSSTPKVNFQDFRARCAQEGITGVFFEGGAQLLSELLQARELDYLFTYHAPVLFADDKGKAILRGLRTESLANAIRLEQVRHEVQGDDALMRGFVKYPEKMFVDEATFNRKEYGA